LEAPKDAAKDPKGNGLVVLVPGAPRGYLPPKRCRMNAAAAPSQSGKSELSWFAVIRVEIDG